MLRGAPGVETAIMLLIAITERTLWTNRTTGKFGISFSFERGEW
jgi:hypothetical protein